jgi:heat shock protein HslJ
VVVDARRLRYCDLEANMSPKHHHSTATLFLRFAIAVVIVLSTQPTHAQDSWLDRSLVNWNRQSGALPQLPQPSTPQGESANADKCRQQVRRPASATERALVQRGWRLYGPVYSYDVTRIVTALSGFDGMCRPLGHQAFVYWEDRYAGTLSPVPMSSRAEGSLTNIRLTSLTSFSADFVRYKGSDALCCPSGVSTVFYSLRRDDIPILAPETVIHTATPHTRDSPKPGPDARAAQLFSKRWTLTEMENRTSSADVPYIEFDRDQQRTSGSSGCNRFTGTFQIDGSMLKFSRIAGTRRACLDADVQHLEMTFLKLLETTTRFEVQENGLRLFADDVLVLAFVAK